ncbi:murein biosynthesis integral membrane protein MurJ [Tistrella bauzanensis]|uniref:Probable lipid II flippase MurJ n=1 Tax=Tistrella arctica TaxID=3133430 RepID=A0ABU9YGE8_9PROT
MSLIRAAATVGGLTMMSRVLGFARDVLVAGLLGAGASADAFFVAQKIPNLLRRMFAEGAFSAAFVPIYNRIRVEQGAAAAHHFAEQALAVLVTSLVLILVLAEAAMPAVVTVFAPGFADDPATFGLAVDLARIVFPYVVFISAVALVGGVLNSLGRFSAFAAAPVLFNLCLIGGCIVSLQGWSDAGAAVVQAWALLLSGMVQLGAMLVAAHRAGAVLRFRLPRITPQVSRLLKVAAPAALGAGVYQVNVLVDTMIASLLAEGTVSALYYADRLVQLPLGVVGIAVGTALLPLLSRRIREGALDDARSHMNRAIEITLLVSLPALVGLATLGLPIVATLFERGAFTNTATIRTVEVMTLLSLGLPAFVLAKVLSPGFYAREDTATPTRYAVVALVANVVLNLAFMQPLAHMGIALATALSAWINVFLLARRLNRDRLLVADARMRRTLPRLILANLLFAGAILGALHALPAFADMPHAARAFWLALLIAATLPVYIGLALLTGAARLADFRALLRRRRG